MTRRGIEVSNDHTITTRTAWRVAALTLAVLAAVQPLHGAAHSGQAPTPETIWVAWNWDPGSITLLVLGTFLFWRGTRRIWRRVGRGRGVRTHQALAFRGAVLVLIVAIVSPLDALGDALFSGHMVQHLLLMMIAAPLLVVARPAVPALHALPAQWRRFVAGLGAPGTVVRRAWRTLTAPVVAWVVHGLTIWLWHTPALYDAAVRSPVIHSLEHAMFLGTAIIFWWSIIPARRSEPNQRYGLAVLSLFTTAIHTGLLAALITFSGTIWYTSHSDTPVTWGLSPLQDQQLAGVIMWVPMSTIYVVAAALVLAAGLSRMEDETEDIDATPAPSQRAPESG